jgi:hypothetical protein
LWQDFFELLCSQAAKTGSCDLCRTRGKGLLVKKGNLSILQKIVWELFLAYGIA